MPNTYQNKKRNVLIVPLHAVQGISDLEKSDQRYYEHGVSPSSEYKDSSLVINRAVISLIPYGTVESHDRRDCAVYLFR